MERLSTLSSFSKAKTCRNIGFLRILFLIPGPFSANSNGWTSNTLGLEWLSSVFEPKTRAKAEGKTRLLICDGHDSHINGFFISFCMANDIQLLILPPYTSHMLQPLDVAIFGPLKRALTTAMMPLHEARLERIQKAEWMEAYNKARENCFTSRNISSAWRGAGLIPFDQKRVERNLHIEKTVEPSQAQTAPQTPNKRIYDKLLITSSSPSLESFRRHVMTCAMIWWGYRHPSDHSLGGWPIEHSNNLRVVFSTNTKPQFFVTR